MSLNSVHASGCSLTMYSYNKARQIKTSQDNYCAKVDAGDFEAVAGTPFPEDLQWEALVDVLRGRVKVGLSGYVNRYPVLIMYYRSKSTATRRSTSTMSSEYVQSMLF